jgi:hypothetical protein
MNFLHPSELERLRGHEAPSPPRPVIPSPSDLILLNGAQWSRSGALADLRVLRKLPEKEALYSALATSFLANEAAGNMELTVVISRHLRSIRIKHVETRVMDPRQRWSAGSLEALLNVSGTVQDLVRDFIGDKAANPEAVIAARLVGWLADRRVINREVQRRRPLAMGSRKRERLLLPPEVYRRMTGAESVKAARLMADAGETRHELMTELLSDIRAAFVDRTDKPAPPR